MLDRLTDWTARAMLVFAAVLGLVLSFIVCADVLDKKFQERLEAGLAKIKPVY